MATPCWYCTHFTSIDTNTSISACSKIGCMVKSRDGCQHFERMPGVDDDEWTPLKRRLVAWKPEAAAAPRAQRGHDGWWSEPARPRRERRTPPAPTPLPDVFAIAFRGFCTGD